MKMNNDLELYSEILSNENPITIFEDANSTYHDYYTNATKTQTFNNAMRAIALNYFDSYGIGHDRMVNIMLIVSYASIFEMFCEDKIIESFQLCFPKYCEQVLLNSTGSIYKDHLGNTFLHYTSHTTEHVNNVQKLYEIVKTHNPNVLNPSDIKNVEGIPANNH